MNNARPTLAALTAVTLLAAGLYTGAARADLVLDTGFDSDGVAEVNFAAGGDSPSAIAVQGDGQLVLGGRSRQTSGAVLNDYVALTRLDGDTGAPDAGFGTAGQVLFLPGVAAVTGAGAEARGLAIQPVDQKIVVAGTWNDNEGTGPQIFVARLDTADALDAGFGTGGIALLTLAGEPNAIATGVALQSDGSILVTGTAGTAGTRDGILLRLTSTGSLDASFATAGVYALANPVTPATNFSFNALHVYGDDGILAAGGGDDVVLVKLTSSGQADNSFSGDGIASFNVISYDDANGPATSYDVPTSLAVLGDGRILVAGKAGASETSTASNTMVARLSAGGVLDTTFGSGGFAPLPDAANQEVAAGIGVRPSGDIVIAGLGVRPTQISPNGIAVSILAGTFGQSVTALQVLADGSVVAAADRTVTGADTEFAAVRLTATDLADGPDTVPDPFAFATQTGAEPGVSVTSNTITVTGFDSPAPITVTSGDLYSIGCSVFGSAPGTINSGDTLCVRTDASLDDVSARNVLVTIGGVAGLFTVVTGDATPDAFTFTDQTDVPASTVVTSDPITLAGLTTRTDVSVTGGSYSVGCTADYVSSPSRVDPGVEICVRHTSSASPGGTTNTLLRVGVSTFITDTFTSTTEGDITPDAFSFTAQPDVPKSTVITSNTVTLTGFTSDAPISVSGGTYSVGCGSTFKSAAGTVAPGAQVCVRHTSSSTGGTATVTTLTVGGVNGVFTSTTAGAPDPTPDPFAFADQTGVPLATVITSGVVTLSGFDTNTTISITGGSYSVGCTATFTSATSSNLPPNSQVCVRHTSASSGGTATNTVLTVGGISDTFTSTTLAGNADPAAFSFTDQAGVDLYADITSAPVTITGIDIASPVSVTGGEYSIGCTSNFTSSQGSITNNKTVCVRHKSSFTGLSNVDTTLTVGTVSDTFTSTTRAGDQTPDDFAFASKVNIARDTLIESDPITITGIDSPVAVSASGPRDAFNQQLFGFSIGCTGDFNDLNGAVLMPGDELCVAVISADADSTGVVMTVTIGGSSAGTQKSATFTVTTGETVPDPFAFTPEVGVLLNATVYADPITITGISSPARVEISNGQYRVNCTGSYTALPGVVSDGETICVRQFASGSLGTMTSTVLTVGGVSATFTSTTVVDKPLPGTSAMDAWSLLLLAPLAGYRRRRRAG